MSYNIKNRDKVEEEKYLETPSTNACKQCAPLGASLAFRGVENCVPLIHGSQGCATYIRRYMISHFREPIDIASSSFAESSTIFGGGANFNIGIDNIIGSYSPDVIGISTSCLSETIGDDVRMLIREYQAARPGKELPFFLNASTPSYKGTHIDGFHAAVRATVERCCELRANDLPKYNNLVNIFPGLLSPADMRYLNEVFEDYNMEVMMMPDYSETLDGPTMKEYEIMPKGGTPVRKIMSASDALGTIQFGRVLGSNASMGAGEFLEDKYEVPDYKIGIPIGIRETDEFHKTMRKLSGIKLPGKYMSERSRLVDALIDGHKYTFGKRVMIYGDADMVCGLTSFACEIGLHPILCASGEESPEFEFQIKEIIARSNTPFDEGPCIISGADFESIKEVSAEMSPDLMIGNSKGYYISRPMKIPLVRCGFPIHDRVGAQRVLHVGYHGAMQLFDKMCNALIEYKQENSKVGYKYI